MHVSLPESRGVARAAWGLDRRRTRPKDADSVRTVNEKTAFAEGPKMASARLAIGVAHTARIGGVGWMVFPSSVQRRSGTRVILGPISTRQQASACKCGASYVAGSFKVTSQQDPGCAGPQTRRLGGIDGRRQTRTDLENVLDTVLGRSGPGQLEGRTW